MGKFGAKEIFFCGALTAGFSLLVLAGYGIRKNYEGYKQELATCSQIVYQIEETPGQLESICGNSCYRKKIIEFKDELKKNTPETLEKIKESCRYKSIFNADSGDVYIINEGFNQY